MKYIFILFGLLCLLLLFLGVRTLFVSHKIKLLPRTSLFNQTTLDDYGTKLGKMVQCKTISYKDHFDDSEFMKLRKTMKDLFPLVHQQAEIKQFSDDCWLYKIKGKDDNHKVMVMSHHDVVEAKGNWHHDPFGGDIVDGNVWGRGSVDTKTALFAQFQAIEEILSRNELPACTTYIASSHNEEIGGDGIPCMKEYLKENKIQLDYVLDEGGAIIEAPLPGLTCKCAMMAVHEKGRYTLSCEALDGMGHRAFVEKKQAPINRIAAFINEISIHPPFIVRIHPQIKAMFQELCPYMNFKMRFVFSNLWLFSPIIKKIMPKLNAQAAGMVSTTCSFQDIESGTKDGFPYSKVSMFLRSIELNDFKEEINRLEEIAKKYNIELTAISENEFYPPANLSSPYFEKIRQSITHIFPDIASAPYILPAGTDARHLCDICDCVIRFAPIDITPAQFSSVHGENENISLQTIGEAVAFYQDLLR
ncbi:MAG: M20/M25/M40 family metallo-hydrolase [Erysipelotrichaceae bacterium]